jgi:hypothetical protein
MRTNVGAGLKPAHLTVVVTLCLVAPLLGSMPAGRTGKAPAERVRFAPVHIYLDSGRTPLAAYQFELVCSGPGTVGAGPRARPGQPQGVAPTRHYEPQCKIVGVEGGEHPAFREAPYYDPAALLHDRIIIAAFNTGSDLPTGRTRIATIHLQILGDTEPRYELKLIVAADATGNHVPAEISWEKGEQK